MKLFISCINSHEDSYRVCNEEGYSQFKGTKEGCHTYIQNSNFFIMCKRRGILMGINKIFKYKEDAEEYLNEVTQKESSYRDESFYIEERVR